MPVLARRSVEEASRAPRRPVDPATMAEAASIVEEVRAGGEVALRRHGERLGDLVPGEDLVVDRAGMERAWDSLQAEHRRVLARVAGRIGDFAAAQLATVTDLDVAVPGGRAGHRWAPVERVGAYAPGGRHPLPSSVLMTVIPARVAGVASVWVASPRPSEVTLAAALAAGADGVLRLGGAQAVAALVFGTLSPSCDLLVGPGNRWVTAAKKHLYGEVGIDGLAGPSEILVIADRGADPHLVAADLLAQAEHDVDAVPILVSTSRGLVDEVDRALAEQMTDLPTSPVASAALGNGYAVVAGSIEEAVGLAELLASEHVALHVADPDGLAGRLSNYGSLFLGEGSAEVFADYGMGPNHVLPTGGGARFQSGLSVFTFLRSPTWSRLEDPGRLVEDTVALARLEGLEAHARAAQRRDHRATAG